MPEGSVLQSMEWTYVICSTAVSPSLSYSDKTSQRKKPRDPDWISATVWLLYIIVSNLVESTRDSIEVTESNTYGGQ